MVDPNGLPCGCGRRGCLETLVSGPAILQRVREAARHADGPPWLTQTASQPSARVAIEHLWDAWLNGRPGAKRAMDPVLDRLGQGLGMLVNILDPALMIAGGYVLQHHDRWRDLVVERARAWVLRSQAWRPEVISARATSKDLLGVIAARYAVAVMEGSTQ